MQFRRQNPLTLVVGVLCLLVAAGCEELGPDARGEINTTALQRVGTERTCLPFIDVANVQSQGEYTLKFALRDGSHWENQVSSPSSTEFARSACTLDQSRQTFLFDSDADEICADEVVFVGVRIHQLSRYLGRCRLGTFKRI
jgi:hypothetical protein